MVPSAFGTRCSPGVSLLVGCSLNSNVNLVFAGNEGRLVVAVVIIKSFEFRMVTVYAPNIVFERRSFFVVRSSLKRVPNGAVKCNAFMREEEFRRFPQRYSEFVKSSDGLLLWFKR